LSTALRVDHLVYAAPALDPAVAGLEDLLGVRAVPGGRHPGEGTRNALIPLRPEAYLEIVAPDPDQPAPRKPRWFGIDGLVAPRLAAWAAKGTGLDQLVARAARAGLTLGRVREGSRQRPDGAILTWQLTDPPATVADGVVPFFIDWGSSAHPSGAAPREIELVSLRAEHPEGDRIAAALLRVGMSFEIEVGPAPALIATLKTPRGRIVLT
jgi:hypothetical protein